jgi:ribosomal-protein-alanine N-acetyltransferase
MSLDKPYNEGSKEEQALTETERALCQLGHILDQLRRTRDEQLDALYNSAIAEGRINTILEKQKELEARHRKAMLGAQTEMDQHLTQKEAEARRAAFLNEPIMKLLNELEGAVRALASTPEIEQLGPGFLGEVDGLVQKIRITETPQDIRTLQVALLEKLTAAAFFLRERKVKLPPEPPEASPLAIEVVTPTITPGTANMLSEVTSTEFVRRPKPPKYEELCVHIRWMIRRDMPEVLSIEANSFEYPWSEEDFLRCLRQRNCIGMVAEHGENVVGFMIYELHKNKLHILNFAVDPKQRLRKVGTGMTDKLASKLSSHRRTSIDTYIRESNLDALLFFKQEGYRAQSPMLRNYYEDSGEDAIRMKYTTPEAYEESDTEKPVNRIAQYEEES